MTDTALLCWPFAFSSIPGTGSFTLAPGMGVECNGDGTYIAVGPDGPLAGTCVYLGP